MKNTMGHPTNHDKFQSKRPVKITSSAPTPVKNAGKALNAMRKRRNYGSANT